MSARSSFSAPVRDVIVHQDLENEGQWPEYLTLYGLKPAHCQELVRVIDEYDALYEEHGDKVAFADRHAWRALAQLRCAEAIPTLIDLADEDVIGASVDFQKACAVVGPAALDDLSAVLSRRRNNHTEIVACFGVQAIAMRDPAEKERCLAILLDRMTDPAANEVEVNTALLIALRRIEPSRHYDQVAKIMEDDLYDEGSPLWSMYRD